MKTKLINRIVHKDKQSAYTLIELLVTLAIVSMLIMIAYPAYKLWILKSHRADAIATLNQDQIILERCYAQNFSYNAACASLPAFPQLSTQQYYTINISNITATTYTLTATPTGQQIKDTLCASISTDQANQKTATDNAGNSQPSCWTP